MASRAPDTGGFEYHLKLVDVPGVDGLQNTGITWGKALEGSARELLASAESDSEGSCHTSVLTYLEGLLNERGVRKG